MPEIQQNPTAPRQREIIRCAKCDTENLAGATRCHDCGAHLYLACRQCGRANLRSNRQCSACGHRIGRGFMARLRDKYVRRWTKTELTLGLLVFFLLVLGAIHFVEVMLGPPTEEPPTPVYEHTVPTKDPSKLPEGAEPAPKAD
jgi:hypothetical protein